MARDRKVRGSVNSWEVRLWGPWISITHYISIWPAASQTSRSGLIVTQSDNRISHFRKHHKVTWIWWSLSHSFSPVTRTVVSLLMVLPLHCTSHWYLVRSSVTVMHNVRTDVWCLPSDWREAFWLTSSLTNRETDSDWTIETAPPPNLNHLTSSSLCLAPRMVHLRLNGTWAYMMLGWLISETLGRAVQRDRNSCCCTIMKVKPSVIEMTMFSLESNFS